MANSVDHDQTSTCFEVSDQKTKVKWAASWQTNKMAWVLSEDSIQVEHPPSLIRIFTVRMKKAWFLSYPLNAQRRLWSDWADAQADLSLCWVRSHFVCFVMRQLQWFEPEHNKSITMIFTPSRDSEQPVHPQRLISVFAVCLISS